MTRHNSFAAVLICGVSITPAVAQEEGGIAEVLVTAQKREQSLQDVPLSVSAYDANFMDDTNSRDLRDLVDVTPGFSGKTEDTFTDALSVRGISTNDYGIGGDPSIGIFVDGFYEGRNGGSITTTLDPQRVEVVKGPQGTLFGRNAIAGAISVTTQKPVNSFEGRVSAAVEEYNHFEGTGTINVPLSDRIWARATLHHMQDGGFLKNVFDGRKLGFHNRDAAQGAIRYAGDSLDMTVTAFYEDKKGAPSVYWSSANGLPKDNVNIDLGKGKDEAQIFRIVSNVEYTLANDSSFTGIVGYKTYDFSYLEDYDAGPLTADHYLQDQEVDYYSGELRFNSPTDGRFVWFIGASYYHEDVKARFQNIYDEDDLCRALVSTEVGPTLSPDDFTWPAGTTVTGCDDATFESVWGSDIDPAALLSGKAETNFDNGTYKGYAFYADATFSFSDKLDLSAGIRYTNDRKQFGVMVLDSGGALGNNLTWEFFTDGFVRAESEWDAVSPRLAVNYKVTGDVSIYGNVAKGYKSGGFATFGLDLPSEPLDGVAPPGTRPKEFDAEKVVAIEVGSKGRWLDGKLTTNISFFNYDYDDLQLSFFVAGSNLVDNVAEASGWGSELEIRWVPDEHWDLLFTASYLNTNIESVDEDFLADGGCDNCKGNDLWQAPDWTTATLLTYRTPLFTGKGFFTVEHFYEGKKFAGPDNISFSRTDAWNEVNLRIGYDAGTRWSAAFYVNNLFSETYFERGWENADSNDELGYGLRNTLVWPSKPRTIGFKVGYRF